MSDNALLQLKFSCRLNHGINKVNSLLKDMCVASGFNGKVTNHSARKTMIQKLKDNNVPDTDIIQLSGHRNLQSLNSYNKLNEDRQERLSNLLNVDSGSIAETLPVTETYGNTAGVYDIAARALLLFMNHLLGLHL